jgi:hypothetical protein
VLWEERLTITVRTIKTTLNNIRGAARASESGHVGSWTRYTGTLRRLDRSRYNGQFRSPGGGQIVGANKNGACNVLVVLRGSQNPLEVASSSGERDINAARRGRASVYASRKINAIHRATRLQITALESLR